MSPNAAPMPVTPLSTRLPLYDAVPVPVNAPTLAPERVTPVPARLIELGDVSATPSAMFSVAPEVTVTLLVPRAPLLATLRMPASTVVMPV